VLGAAAETTLGLFDGAAVTLFAMWVTTHPPIQFLDRTAACGGRTTAKARILEAFIEHEEQRAAAHLRARRLQRRPVSWQERRPSIRRSKSWLA